MPRIILASTTTTCRRAIVKFGGGSRPQPQQIVRVQSSSSSHNNSKRPSLAVKRTKPPSKTNSDTSSSVAKSDNDSTLVNAPRTRGRDDDSLSRYPNFQSAGGILRGLDYAGTLTFALTGSVTAAQCGLDVFGASMIGMVTAVGGGTIRDAVFLAKRPFWTSETEYVWMSVLTGCLTFFAWPQVMEWKKQRQSQQEEEGEEKSAMEDGQLLEARQKEETPNDNSTTSSSSTTTYDGVDAALDTLDAIGLSAFCIIGAQNGVRAGMPMAVSAICGMATSTFGGLSRDVVCGRPVRIVHSNAEVYAQPALAGAITYLVAKRHFGTPAITIGSAFAVCMGSRYLAVKHDVRLHTWDTQQDGLGVAVRRNS